MDKLKLLVVDDEKNIVELVKRACLEKGFTTFGATDGLAAIELFEKEKPEIVIIDVHMPFSRIDGIETLEKIKKIDKNTVCIMITRIDDKDKVEAARRLGALHYISKPLTIEELDVVVDEAAGIARKGKE